MKHRKASTLVELLVVLAVLALLLALVLPSLQSGRQSGITILCANNLRQLNLISAIYCDQNLSFPQGFCMLNHCVQTPPQGGFPGDHSNDWRGRWWFHYLEIEDLTSDGILWCPARKKTYSVISDNILCSNYGINYSIAKRASEQTNEEFLGSSLRKDQLRRPSQTLLYMDSGYALISWKAAAEMNNLFDNPARQSSFYLPGLDINRDRSIHPDQQDDAIKGRHPRQNVTVGLADGHVRRQPAEDLFVQSNQQSVITAVSSAYIWSPGE